jgi:hypothetical protein
MMAQAPKKDTLSLRLDPKTRFIVEFASRVKGQTITAFIESAIREHGKTAQIDGGFEKEDSKTWTDYWDVSDGVRTLSLISDQFFPTNFEEDEIRQFTLDHWEFFYTSREGSRIRRGYVDIIWPDLNDYLSLWRSKKGNDYWAAGREMAKKLSAADVKAPVWPRSPAEEPKKAPSTLGGFSRDLDDEIPF